MPSVGSSALFMAACAAAATCLAQPQAYPLRPAVEFTVRGGLPNLAAKLQAGKAVRLAYLGGSITAQPGWRPQTLAWFRAEYPGATVDEINAAIGGTGSDLGVFRLGQDVLQHRPDLVFVEFAVNDGGAEPERIIRAMEGIVRQAWQQDPTTDLCFVYTVTQNLLPDLQAGRYPRAASAMEAVADAYQIPSIHLGLEVARLAQQGKLVMVDPQPTTEAQRREAMAQGIVHFSPDGVHPYPDSGHVLYCQAAVRGLRASLAAGTPGAHERVTPLRPDHWQSATLVPLERASLSPEWRRLDPAADATARSFAGRLPQLWLADAPGARITFRFKGTLVRLYDLVGPTGGSVKVTVDGEDLGVRHRFDAYCTYYRLQTMPVAENLTDGLHTVTLELLAEAPDKRRILGQREAANAKDLALDEAAFAAKYGGRRWYAGMIMLLGELVP